jgi:hypothetical protein
MTHANKAPWFTKAGAANSIMPISHFVGPHIFALKGGGYLRVPIRRVRTTAFRYYVGLAFQVEPSALVRLGARHATATANLAFSAPRNLARG